MSDENSGKDIQISYTQLKNDLSNLNARYMKLKKRIPDISLTPLRNYLGLLDVTSTDISGEWRSLPGYIHTESLKK
tara:strand:- start:1568 stop:1795 length:228 start_codon:yes stop_codon:yes gene_type:complete